VVHCLLKRTWQNSAHQAIVKAKGYYDDGYISVVDIDLAKYGILTTSLTNEYLASIGYDDIAKRYEALHLSY